MCLFYYSLFYICSQQKRPRKPKLSESHKYYPKFNRRSKNYSMIVATLPDPTVRPPSRYQTGVLLCANGDFSCDLCGKIRIFHCVRMVFGDFVIMVLSHLAIRKTKYLLSHNFLFSWPFQHIVLIRLFLLF